MFRNLSSIIFYWFFGLSICCASESLTFGTGMGHPMIPIASSILDTAYQKLGVQFKVQGYSPERSLVLSNKGVTDGQLFLQEIDHHQYPNLIKIPIPLATGNLMIFTKNRNLQVDGWAGLTSYRVGSQAGIREVDKHQDDLNNIHMLKSGEQLFRMLARERLDVVILPRLVGSSILKRSNLKGIKMLPTPLEKNALYHYLNVKHLALVPQITQVLRAMLDSGELDSIRKQIEINLLNTPPPRIPPN